MRFSTTLIEKLQLYRHQDEERQWMNEQELLDSIMGKWSGNPNTDRGQAFGRAIEKPDKYRMPDGTYKVQLYGTGVNGIPQQFVTFDATLIDTALDKIEESCADFGFTRRDLIFEVPASKVYPCGHEAVAKVDGIGGNVIFEFKNTENFNIEKYMDGCQQKFYLDVFGAKVLRYVVFEVNVNENIVDLRNTHAFDVFPYPELSTDCNALVQEFAEFIESKGLEAFCGHKLTGKL